eukprot:295191-Chlamydomonas_euryale.AAC.2
MHAYARACALRRGHELGTMRGSTPRGSTSAPGARAHVCSSQLDFSRTASQKEPPRTGSGASAPPWALELNKSLHECRTTVVATTATPTVEARRHAHTPHQVRGAEHINTSWLTADWPPNPSEALRKAGARIRNQSLQYCATVCDAT